MAVFTVTGKITNLFMRLNETTADVFCDQPEIYLKCIKKRAIIRFLHYTFKNYERKYFKIR